MSFSIEVLENHIEMRLFGIVTGNDLLQLMKGMKALEAPMECVLDRISDFSSVEKFEVSFEHVFKFAQSRRGQSFPNILKSVLVAKRPVEIGFARMFSTLNDNPQIEIKIVSTLDEAKDWLNDSRSSQSH